MNDDNDLREASSVVIWALVGAAVWIAGFFVYALR